MKLKHGERGYEQRRADQTIGAYPFQDDEFVFNKDFSEIALPCPRGRFDRCIIRITTGDAIHPVWHWNGNKEAPTLTPSIGCDHRCGWHGSVTNGEMR